MTIDLAFYQSRTKVKGQDISARFKELIQRWTKVHEDCNASDDKSRYRQAFGQMHLHVLELVSLTAATLEEPRRILETIKGILMDLGFLGLGEREAAGFILTEINLALEE